MRTTLDLPTQTRYQREIAATARHFQIDATTAEEFAPLADQQYTLHRALVGVDGYTGSTPTVIDGKPVVEIHYKSGFEASVRDAVELAATGSLITEDRLVWVERVFSRRDIAALAETVVTEVENVVPTVDGEPDVLVLRADLEGRIAVTVDTRIASALEIDLMSGVLNAIPKTGIAIDVTGVEGPLLVDEIDVGPGGRPFGLCTAGFGVAVPLEGNSRTAVSTAGHCNDGADSVGAITVDERTIESGGEDCICDGYDFQVHPARAGDQLTNGQTGGQIGGIVEWGTPDAGTFLCVDGSRTSGNNTETECQAIPGWFLNINHISFDAHYTTGGDSGSPYAFFGRAYGSHEGRRNADGGAAGGVTVGVRLDQNMVRTNSFVQDGAEGDDFANSWLYNPIPIARVFDTFVTDESREYQIDVQSALGLPGNSSMRGAMLSIAVAQPSGPGFVQIGPSTENLPVTSVLNYRQGGAVSNAAYVRTSRDGVVSFKMSTPGRIIVDVVGWSTDAGGGDTPTASRFIGDRTPARQDVTIPANGVATFGTTRGGIEAVVTNIAVVQPGASGWITITPSGTSPPNAANMNFIAGENKSQLQIARVDGSGNFDLYNNSNGQIRVLVDELGWYVPGNSTTLQGHQTAITSVRRFDSRPFGAGVRLNAGSQQSFLLTDWETDGSFPAREPGLGGVPFEVADYAFINITTIRPEDNGFLTVWGAGGQPNISHHNYTSGVTSGNTMVVPIANDGQITIFSSATTEYTVDVLGWVTEP